MRDHGQYVRLNGPRREAFHARSCDATILRRQAHFRASSNNDALSGSSARAQHAKQNFLAGFGQTRSPRPDLATAARRPPCLRSAKGTAFLSSLRW